MKTLNSIAEQLLNRDKKCSHPREHSRTKNVHTPVNIAENPTQTKRDKTEPIDMWENCSFLPGITFAYVTTRKDRNDWSGGKPGKLTVWRDAKHIYAEKMAASETEID